MGSIPIVNRWTPTLPKTGNYDVYDWRSTQPDSGWVLDVCTNYGKAFRRDANAHLKDLLKEKKIAEDDERHGQDEIQKLTDRHIAEIDKLLQIKEAELMAV